MSDYDTLKSRLADRDWRMANLYHVRDKTGNKVKFDRWESQRRYSEGRWYLNLCVKARQLGMSTEIELEMLDACLFNSNTRCGIIDRTMPDAKKKLAIVQFAYDALPDALKEARPTAKANTEEIEWANGSSIAVGTSHRGGTLQRLHISEFGPISAESPERAREIVTGGFNTVAVGQMIDVESTSAGTGGEFYEMVQRAEAQQKQKRPLGELDFKLHFFPWWQEQGYRLNPNGVVLTAQLEEYFADLAKQGVALDPAQRAFYIGKFNLLGPDDVLKEYPSTIEECFKSSVEGAYFKREMMRMRTDGRIGQMPFDPSRKVNTFWDIGHSDPNFIIFHQTDGVRHRLIDCYEAAGEQLAHCITVLKERKDKYGYEYGKHFGPHDLDHTDWSADINKTRKEIAASRGVNFDVVPRVFEKGDAIEAARRFLNLCWIDESKCARLVQCLDNYRREWDENRGVWRNQPHHDWASHGADCVMTGAMGYEPERAPGRERNTASAPMSAWAA